MLDFTKMDIAAVMSGVDPDGERYLSKFLKEYKSIFGGTVNPSCPKCLSDYLSKYKKAMAKTVINAENSGYKLLAKYENIPLEFGSPVLVNNTNLTDEYAEKLLKREHGEKLFSSIPESGAKTKTKKPKAAPVAPTEKVEPVQVAPVAPIEPKEDTNADEIL